MRVLLFLLCVPLLSHGTAHAADVPAPDRPDTAARPATWGPADPKTNVETGARLRPAPEPRVFGRLLHFDLYVRNPTDRIVEGTFSTEEAVYTPPSVEDEAGRPVKVHAPTVRLLGTWALIRYRLNPNESRFVASAALAFDPDDVPDPARLHCVAVAGPGKYKVTYPNAAPVTFEIR